MQRRVFPAMVAAPGLADDESAWREAVPIPVQPCEAAYSCYLSTFRGAHSQCVLI